MMRKYKSQIRSRLWGFATRMLLGGRTGGGVQGHRSVVLLRVLWRAESEVEQIVVPKIPQGLHARREHWQDVVVPALAIRAAPKNVIWAQITLLGQEIFP